MRMDAEPEDVINFLVEHLLGQAKRRDLREHKPAALELLVKKMDLIPERGEITSYCERRRAGTDERDLFAIRLERALRHIWQRVVAKIRGYALEATDRDGLFVDAAAAASRFAWAIARAAED